MSDIYQLVRNFYEIGPPASRNLAFEAYQDKDFASAVRIYQFLKSIAADLKELAAAEDGYRIDTQREGESIRLIIEYKKRDISRTAYLKEPEYELLCRDPDVAFLLPAEVLNQAAS